MILRQSVQSGLGIRSRSEALGRFSQYDLQVGASVGTPWLQEEDMGQEEVLLSEYMSLHLSLKLTSNCVPLPRIKWEIYFYKEVYFVHPLKFVRYLWSSSWLGLWEVYNRAKSTLLFTHDWKEYSWIHAFPKSFSVMLCANSLVQNLNSSCHVHFLQR